MRRKIMQMLLIPLLVIVSLISNVPEQNAIIEQSCDTGYSTALYAATSISNHKLSNLESVTAQNAGDWEYSIDELSKFGKPVSVFINVVKKEKDTIYTNDNGEIIDRNQWIDLCNQKTNKYANELGYGQVTNRINEASKISIKLISKNDVSKIADITNNASNLAYEAMPKPRVIYEDIYQAIVKTDAGKSYYINMKKIDNKYFVIDYSTTGDID